jgi:hypothetical protein
MSYESVHAHVLDTAPPFEVTRVFYAAQNQAHVRAAGTTGGFLIVWSSRPDLETGSNISALRLNLEGQHVGTEFFVNSPDATVDADSPVVEPLPDGAFLVAWIDNGVEQAVRARRVSADGSQGTELTVAGPTSEPFYDVEAAAAGDGSFVVVWRAPASGGSRLLVQRYAPDGTPALPPIEPTAGGSNDIKEFSASGDSQGRFVVAWTEGLTYQTGAAGGYQFFTRYEGRARLIGADGTPGATIAMGEYGMRVRHQDNDGFVVAWAAGGGSYDVPRAPFDVFRARMNEDGSPRDTLPLQLSNRTGEEEDGPFVSLAGDDAGFLVAWQHWAEAADPSVAGFVRGLDDRGRPDGPPIPLVPAGLPADTVIEPVAALAADKALVAWQLDDSIQAQLFTRIHDVLCGDASRDDTITATDALAALQAAVGARYCSLQLCDADDSGSVTASDALAILRAAVGSPSTLECPA